MATATTKAPRKHSPRPAPADPAARQAARGSRVLRGRERPRLMTPPLRQLTRRTTLGYRAVAFIEGMCGMELLPWQRWWLLHALELAPGENVDDLHARLRFRTVLTLVSRQNGKTALLKGLSLYLMFSGRVRMILGAAQSLDIARESWQGAVDLADDDRELKAEIEAVRRTNGEQELRLVNGTRYRIAAATRSAGRGLSVDLLILDELREHRDWAAWGALTKTTIARANALTCAISNAGDDQSVVLNQLRGAALAGTDSSLGIFEWSAPDGCALDDRRAWAQANPGLGWTISEQALASALATDPPAVFRTENLCQRVDSLDGAIDPGAWHAGRDPQGSLGLVRAAGGRIVVVLDVAPDGQHVTLAVGGQLTDGRLRVEMAGSWTSVGAARFALAGLIERIKPDAFGWFPAGPAAALGPDIRAIAAAAGVKLVEIKGAAVTECCQGFAELVASRLLLHPGDPLLDAHVAGASKLISGDGYRFARRGVAGHVDAVYAAAGVAHVLRTLPIERAKPRSAVY